MTRDTLSSQGWAESIIFVLTATDHVVSLLMESKWWNQGIDFHPTSPARQNGPLALDAKNFQFPAAFTVGHNSATERTCAVMGLPFPVTIPAHHVSVQTDLRQNLPTVCVHRNKIAVHDLS